jgi:hypothetical protein
MIFDDVTGDEASVGVVRYRGIAIQNENTTINLTNAKVWITGYVRAASGYDVISIARKQPSGSPASIPPIASETVAPTIDGSWVNEGAPSSTLDLAGTAGVNTIGMNGDWCGIWIRDSVPAGATVFNNRSCTIQVQGETSASPLREVSNVFAIHWDWSKNDFRIERSYGTEVKAEIL